jgi:trk system potassium uptake protein TrkA
LKVCIVGAGVVGSYLAKRLSKEGFEVIVVDVDGTKLEAISHSLDVMTVNCDATEVNCLKKVKDANLFVVVTESDEKNVAITTLIRAFLKKEKVVLRVSNKAFSSPPVKELLGSEVVNILSETVQAVINQVKYPFAIDTIRLEGEGLVIFKLKLNVESHLSGRQIAELSPIRKEIPFTIVAIEREKETIIPSGQSFLYAGDVIYVAVKEEDGEKLARALGIEYEPVKSVFVLGYSRFTEELLTQLVNLPLKVKFISPEFERCEEVAGKFPKVDVFHGEISDVELLKGEGIGKADLVISVTNDEEDNILSSILSKQLGAKKACALIFHPEYEGIINSIGIDVPIVPRKLLASKVYRMLSRKKLLEIFELSKDLEVVELEVSDKNDGKRLKDANLCNLVVAVKNETGTEIAKGDTLLHKGDVLICIKKR